MTEPKYPNANISPERLKEIEQGLPVGVNHLTFNPHSALGKIYDLLAMLHDQRWRKLSEVEPGLSETIVIKLEDEPNDGTNYITLCFGVDEHIGEWEYWFPILPLPKEI